MRIDLRPRRKNSRRDLDGKRCPPFLQFIRGRQCLVAQIGRAGSAEACSGKIEAAHVDYAGDKGMATKVSDRFAVPLCSYHHAKQHAVGWRTFDRHWLGGVEAALLYAAEFWRAWPGRAKWERDRAA